MREQTAFDFDDHNSMGLDALAKSVFADSDLLIGGEDQVVPGHVHG